MGCNYRELQKMYESYLAIYNELENWLKDFLLEQGKWLLAETKDRTPVDSGYLRKSWRITRVYRLPSGNLGFVLMNDADYASYVENGHTTRNREGWVEGYYMATISIAKLDQYMPRRFDREFKKFLASHGVS